MKYFLILFPFLFLFTNVISQNKIISFTDTVSIPGTSSDELFFRAKSWIAADNSLTDINIRMSDRSFGKIIGKGDFLYASSNRTLNSSVKGIIEFRISLWIKDNKYRYEITNFEHFAIPSDPVLSGMHYGSITNAPTKETNIYFIGGKKKFTIEGWNEIKAFVKSKADKIINSLYNEMLLDELSDW